MPYYLRIVLLSIVLALLTAAMLALAPRPSEVQLVEQTPIGSGIARTTEIRVTFSRSVDRPSAEASFRLVPVAAGSFRWQDTTLIFRPQASLAPATTYNVSIGRGLRDSKGRLNRSETHWSFRTGAQ